MTAPSSKNSTSIQAISAWEKCGSLLHTPAAHQPSYARRTWLRSHVSGPVRSAGTAQKPPGNCCARVSRVHRFRSKLLCGSFWACCAKSRTLCGTMSAYASGAVHTASTSMRAVIIRCMVSFPGRRCLPPPVPAEVSCVSAAIVCPSSSFLAVGPGTPVCHVRPFRQERRLATKADVDRLGVHRVVLPQGFNRCEHGQCLVQMVPVGGPGHAMAQVVLMPTVIAADFFRLAHVHIAWERMKTRLGVELRGEVSVYHTHDTRQRAGVAGLFLHLFGPLASVS